MALLLFLAVTATATAGSALTTAHRRLMLCWRLLEHLRLVMLLLLMLFVASSTHGALDHRQRRIEDGDCGNHGGVAVARATGRVMMMLLLLLTAAAARAFLALALMAAAATRFGAATDSARTPAPCCRAHAAARRTLARSMLAAAPPRGARGRTRPTRGARSSESVCMHKLLSSRSSRSRSTRRLSWCAARGRRRCRCATLAARDGAARRGVGSGGSQDGLVNLSCARSRCGREYRGRMCSCSGCSGGCTSIRSLCGLHQTTRRRRGLAAAFLFASTRVLLLLLQLFDLRFEMFEQLSAMLRHQSTDLARTQGPSWISL